MHSDAGSIPAASTKPGITGDHSRPSNPMIHKGLDVPSPPSLLVGSGPDWSTDRLKSVSNPSHFTGRSDPENILSSLGTAECRRFRDDIFGQHHIFAADLARDYLRVTREHDLESANHRLLEIHEQLTLGDLKLTSSQDDINQFCSTKAGRCRQLIGQHSPGDAWEHCVSLLSSYRISPPDCQIDDLMPSLNRLADERWWKRKVRQLQARTIEQIARDIGMVQQSRSKYSSHLAITRRRDQKIESQKYLESSIIVSNDGEELTLWDVYQHTVSNPAVRRAELMTRISGFEVVAEIYGHTGEFYTLTAPGHMHSSLKRGIKNPNFTGESPLEIQAYLRKTFELIRSKLGRLGISPYGFRVAEPHHDGTPHWHFLLFIPEEKRKIVRAVFSEYALRISPNEKGAKDYRFKAITIDSSKGSAAGYIAKYIAKNIDGAFIQEDLDGGSAKKSARNIDAWASTWGIRQFQQIGGPSVTVWRELRRLEEAKSDFETARKAADSADWAAYCIAMGGISTTIRNASIKPDYAIPSEVDLETGEILDKKTQYGDIVKPRIIGLKSPNTKIRTRLRQWRILRKSSEHSEQDSRIESGWLNVIPCHMGAPLGLV